MLTTQRLKCFCCDNECIPTQEDRLAFTNNFGITGAWNQATGVLALTGSATKANYEQALQTITYKISMIIQSMVSVPLHGYQ